MLIRPWKFTVTAACGVALSLAVIAPGVAYAGPSPTFEAAVGASPQAAEAPQSEGADENIAGTGDPSGTETDPEGAPLSPETPIASLIVTTAGLMSDSELTRHVEFYAGHMLQDQGATGGVTQDGIVSSVSEIIPTVKVVNLVSPVRLDVAERAAEELARSDRVVYADPDRPIQLLEDPQVPQEFQAADWYHHLTGEYGIDYLDAYSKFNGDGLPEGSAYVPTIAVIDTGVYPHVEFGDRLLPGGDTIANAKHSWDYSPCDPVKATTDPAYVCDDTDDDGTDPGDHVRRLYKDYLCPLPVSSPSWHGTHVAGIAAAGVDDSFSHSLNYGAVGVAPGAQIMPMRALGVCTGSYDSQVISAIYRSVNQRNAAGALVEEAPFADVINMSLGSGGQCPASWQAAIDYATEVRNAIVVVSAGNHGKDLTGTVYPASCRNVITVGATSKEGVRSTYSTYGRDVTVSAPGDSIIAPVGDPNGIARNNYAWKSGTSMATPVVAGLAALAKSLNPSMNYREFVSLIRTPGSTKAFAGGACDSRPYVMCGAGILSTHLLRNMNPAFTVTPASTSEDGFTATISPYNPYLDYRIEVSSTFTDAVDVQRTGNLITVSGLPVDVNATAKLKVTATSDTAVGTTQSFNFTGATEFSQITVAAPDLQVEERTVSRVTLRIGNFVPGNTYTVNASKGVLRRDGDRITISGLIAGEVVVVNAVAAGETKYDGYQESPTITITTASLRADLAMPQLGMALPTPDGFTVKLLEAAEPGRTFTAEVTPTFASATYDPNTRTYTVSGISPGIQANLFISAHKDGYQRSVVARTGTAGPRTAPTPQLKLVGIDEGGLLVEVAQYQSLVDNGFSVAAQLEVTVRGSEPATTPLMFDRRGRATVSVPADAEVKVTTTVEQEGFVSTTARQSALTASVYPRITRPLPKTNGFTFTVSNYQGLADRDSSYRAELDPRTPASVTLHVHGDTVTVSGLTPGDKADVRVFVSDAVPSHLTRLPYMVTVTGVAAAPPDSPRISTDHRGVVRVANHNRDLSYSAAVNKGSAHVDANGVVNFTTRGLVRLTITVTDPISGLSSSRVARVFASRLNS